MSGIFQRAVRQLVPPVLLNLLRPRGADRGVIRFTGRYASWADALRHSTGYDAPVILERTRAALAAVRDGRARAERDSVLLAEPEPPLAVIAGLLRAAAERGGHLHVADFGGSLGSTYFQCRDFLGSVDPLQWSVVEQPAHVACGQREFRDGRLDFFADLPAARKRAPVDVLLLSSVLPFLPDPRTFLATALAERYPYVIVDRTFFHGESSDRLTVEHVPADIYPASYPAWFFAAPAFQALFDPAYELLASFPALDQPQLPDAVAWSRGMIYRLKP